MSKKLIRRALLVALLPIAALVAAPDGGSPAAPPGPSGPVYALSASPAEARIFHSVDTSTSTSTTAPPSTTTSSSTTSTTVAPPPPPLAPPAPAPAPAATGNCAGWEDMIAAHFPADQVPKACSVMMCETGGTGNPSSYNSGSGASGLWQFMSQTWESTTGTPAPAGNYSGDVQTAAAAKLWAQSGWGPWSCA